MVLSCHLYGHRELRARISHSPGPLVSLASVRLPLLPSVRHFFRGGQISKCKSANPVTDACSALSIVFPVNPNAAHPLPTTPVPVPASSLPEAGPPSPGSCTSHRCFSFSLSSPICFSLRAFSAAAHSTWSSSQMEASFAICRFWLQYTISVHVYHFTLFYFHLCPCQLPLKLSGSLSV